MDNRIAVFKLGRIEKVTLLMDFYLQPANNFLAQFFGSPKFYMLNSTLGAEKKRKRLDNNTSF